jgi:hypothetical protein
MKYSPILLAAAILIGGCGSTTDRQTRTVETQRTTTSPVVIDSPFGQFTAQPAQVTVQRTQREIETATTSLDLPDVGGAVMMATAGTPWGGIIASVAGLGAAFLGKKAIDNGRQRDELADGVESAKDHMDPDTWRKVKKSLADNQSDDTAKAVKRRVG